MHQLQKTDNTVTEEPRGCQENVLLTGRNGPAAEKRACADAWGNTEHHGIQQHMGGT